MRLLDHKINKYLEQHVNFQLNFLDWWRCEQNDSETDKPRQLQPSPSSDTTHAFALLPLVSLFLSLSLSLSLHVSSEKIDKLIFCMLWRACKNFIPECTHTHSYTAPTLSSPSLSLSSNKKWNMCWSHKVNFKASPRSRDWFIGFFSSFHNNFISVWTAGCWKFNCFRNSRTW